MNQISLSLTPGKTVLLRFVLLTAICLLALSASASTTISTDINTEGTLTVTGISNLKDKIYNSFGALMLDQAGQANTNIVLNPTTGNVGVGTTSPYAKLSAQGLIAGQYFNADSTTGTSTFAGGALFATRGGNVGVGTTSPIGLFEISSPTIIYRIYEGAGAPNILAGYSGNSIGLGENVRANVIAGGGYSNSINHIDGSETRYSTISGGYDNYINGIDSLSSLDGAASTISGGAHHIIKASHATISGGSYGLINISGDYATISGGTSNIIGANASYATIVGGGSNIAAGTYSIVGGNSNIATGTSAVAFGNSNIASSSYSFAVGYGNVASGYSAKALGYLSTASGDYSTVLGKGMTVSGQYSSGIALDNMTGTNVSANNVLSVMGGKVGIGTTTPGEELDVNGQIRIHGSDVGQIDGLILYNTAAPNNEDSTTAINIKAGLDNGSGSFIEAGRIVFGEEDKWNSVATRDSYISLQTRLDNVLSEKLRISSTGNVGIGTTTPTASLQVATSTANATTTIEIGKASQNKGSCLVLYDAGGNTVYAYIATGASTFTLSAVSCK